MTWENKKEMVNLLNERLFDKAVDLYLKAEQWGPLWTDSQALDMFIMGFDLSQAEKALPLEKHFNKVRYSDFISDLDYRATFRFCCLLETFKKIKHQRYENSRRNT